MLYRYRSCLPGRCGGRGKGMPGVAANLVRSLKAIRGAAPNARIVVLGYPRLFDPVGGTPMLPPASKALANKGTALLNATLAASVADARAVYRVNTQYVDVTARIQRPRRQTSLRRGSTSHRSGPGPVQTRPRPELPPECLRTCRLRRSPRRGGKPACPGQELGPPLPARRATRAGPAGIPGRRGPWAIRVPGWRTPRCRAAGRRAVREWLRSTPSCLAPSRAMASRDWWFSQCVRNSTAGQPSASNACRSSRSLESGLVPLPCTDAAFQVEPISTRGVAASMFM